MNEHEVVIPQVIVEPAHNSMLQRQCTCGQHTPAGGECAECRNKREGTLQHRAVNQTGPDEYTSIEHPSKHDFSHLRVHSNERQSIQTKLTINEPGDQYEQEADRLAEQVMRTPEIENRPGAAISEQTRPIQRFLSKDNELHRQPEDEEGEQTEEEQPGDEEEETLQAKEAPGQTPTVTPEVQTRIDSIRGGGQPLPESTRTFMESRFGHDFSQVRVHTDAGAAETARAVSARAFTLGHDIVFGSGAYTPATNEGKRLLAHELTHVVQQRPGKSTLRRQADPQTQEPAAQAEWEAHPNIKARYGTSQKYEAVRGQVVQWTNPQVKDPASYIEEAIGEWDEHHGIHASFGTAGNNFDGHPGRSYLNLKRLYQAQHNISHPAEYLATNIVSIKFYNRNTQGHKDLKAVLERAQKDMTAAGQTFTLGKGTWGYVPRTYNDNINKLSNHALGKAIDVNPSSNPHVKSRKDIMVIDEVCKPILPHGLLKEKSFTGLKKASDYFQANFNNTWVTDQEQLLKQMQLQKPHPKELGKQKKLVEAIHSRRKALDGYASSGFLNLPQELVEGLQKAGLNWGGEWDTAKDFMHFELRNP